MVKITFATITSIVAMLSLASAQTATPTGTVALPKPSELLSYFSSLAAKATELPSQAQSDVKSVIAEASKAVDIISKNSGNTHQVPYIVGALTAASVVASMM